MKPLKPILLLLFISASAFCSQYSTIDLHKTFSEASGESPNHSDLVILDCNDQGECVGTWKKRIRGFYKLFVLPTEETIGKFQFININGPTLLHNSLKINNLSNIIGLCKKDKKTRIFTWDQKNPPYILAVIPGKDQKIIIWNDVGQAILSYNEGSTTHFVLWDRDQLRTLDEYQFKEIVALTNTFKIVGNRDEYAQIVDFSTDEPAIIVPNDHIQNCATGATDHNEVLLGFKVDDEDAEKICPHSHWLYLWNDELSEKRFCPIPILTAGFNNNHKLIGYQEREEQKTAVVYQEGKIQSIEEITKLSIDKIIKINQRDGILVRAVTSDKKPLYYFLKKSEQPLELPLSSSVESD